MTDSAELKCEARGRPYLAAVNSDAATVVFFRPRCKQWSCPACAEINARAWSAVTFYGADALMQSGENLSFVTLTAHERLDRAAALVVWPGAWKKLSTRVARAWGRPEYLLVPEQHKTGKMHVHLLTTCDAPARWWRDNARQCGLGYQVAVESLQDAKIGAWYVTKYLHKQAALNAWPRGFRRVRTSRGWPRPPASELAAGWVFGKLEKEDTLVGEIERYQGWGWAVAVADYRTAGDIIAAAGQ